jgi:alkylation response protein AidB-like acyl-CoA dehydrogenase
MVDLIASPDQREIADSVAGFMRDNLPVGRLRPQAKSARERDDATWRQIAELGWFGIAMPEEHGGAGFGVAEEMLVSIELGRGLGSPAILASVIGARIAAEAGQASLAADIVSGRVRIGIGKAVEGGALDGAISGEFYLIDAAAAQYVVLWTDKAAVLVPRSSFVAAAVRATDEGLEVERGTLSGVKAAARVEGDAIPRRTNLLLAAQMVGIAEATRDLAAEYAKIREQFGQRIGAFQGIKHMCADSAVRAEASRAQVTFAALVQAEDRKDAAFQTSAALVVALDAGMRNARTGIQVHGGIGFTYDCDANLFLKRAHVINILAGGARRHQAAALLHGPQ